MHSFRKNSLTRQSRNCWITAVILLLVAISWTEAPAQSLLGSNQLDMKSVIGSRNLKIIAAIKKGETKGSVVVEISLKNISQKEISFRDTYVLNDYSFVVKSRDGNVVPPSEGGRRKIFESRAVSHRYFVVLRPGEQVMRQLVITEIYDFRPREVYTIIVNRRISLDKGKTLEEARSNIIRAKVGG